MKGVNKLVIEVRPENGNFEKAILFLKPDKQELPQKQISDSAEKLLNELDNKNIKKTYKEKIPIYLLLTGIAAGSAASWLMILAIGLMR